MARFSRKSRKPFDPFSDRTERAPCFRATTYENLLWRETLDEMNTDERNMLRSAESRVPGFATQFATEVAHRLFADPVREIPEENRSPGASLRGVLHREISTPAFASLASTCTMNAHRTRAALRGFLYNLAYQIDMAFSRQQRASVDDAEKLQQGAEGVEQALPGTQHAANAQAQADQAMRNANAQAQQSILNQQAADYATDQGLANADRQAGGSGSSGSGRWLPGSDADASALATTIKGYPEVKEISLLAGKLLPTLTRLADERKTNDAQEKSAIGMGRDVSRLVPRELIDLAGMRGAIPAASAYRRLTDGAAISFGREGKDKLGRGPIVVCVDQSGSMGGELDRWAKAVMLALAVYARREHRAFGVITYDTRVKSCDAWDRGASAKDLTRIASTFHGGGTNWGAPIDRALDLIRQKQDRFKKADIVHVTDGLPSDYPNYEARRVRAASMKVRLWGVAVGPDAEQIAGNPESYLAKWSDAVCAVSDTAQDGTALTLMAKAL
jgi:uncharacterized protein with von Willebrand factor type A (vWA) domain